MGMLNLDLGLMVWTWITFGILLFLLSRFALPGFLKGIEKREATIAKALADAAIMERRLQDANAQEQEILRQARMQADEIVREARSEAQAQRAAILRQAELEAQESLESARRRMETERLEAMTSLRGDLAELICTGTEQLVGRSFLTSHDKEWTREFIEKS